MTTGPQIMKAAADQAGCAHIAFDQMATLRSTGVGATDEGGKGICFGLSVTWLEAQKDGKAASFAANANNARGNNTFARSHLMWKNQMSDMWKSLAGLTPAKDSDGFEKRATFRSTDEDDLKKFTAWLGKAMGKRYFMVGVPGHAMAAFGSSCGTLKFYDPNCGVMSSRSAATLAKGLNAFFSDDTIKRSYKSKFGNFVELQVDKLKAA